MIRRAPPNSRSPYNFEIVLLDHGLYFDLDPELRVNYSKLWLSLIEKASPETRAARRKYAELVGNITPDLVREIPATVNPRLMMSSMLYLRPRLLVERRSKEHGKMKTLPMKTRSSERPG